MTHFLSLTEPQNKFVAEIAEVIKHYYPIGVGADSEEYSEHSGFIELKAKLDEGFTNLEIWKPWNLFITTLQEKYDRKIKNCGSPMDLSFGGELILEKYEDESLIRRKKIIFNISRLATFYTIYGMDETVIKLKNEDRERELYYHAVNVITTSPYVEFKQGFDYLNSKIKEQFKGYKFVPFFYSSFFVKDVKLPFTSWVDTTVYNAIFSGSLNMFHLPKIPLRGDQFYGILRF